MLKIRNLDMDLPFQTACNSQSVPRLDAALVARRCASAAG
jgi:hypothetical protein